jgi:putative transposase
MSSLEDIIDLPANLEVKRALAVKMILFDFKTEDIGALLNVSDAFVSKWKIRFENEGAEALKLNYKGGTGFLTDDQRDEILFHLRMQPHYSVEALRDYIEYHYGVVYHSKQSYYDLLQAAGLSYHQTQATNPKRDEAQVLQKREEIKKNWPRVKPTSCQVKSLFLLKRNVIYYGEMRSAMGGVGSMNGRRFRLPMPNNDRPLMVL